MLSTGQDRGTASVGKISLPRQASALIVTSACWYRPPQLAVSMSV